MKDRKNNSAVSDEEIIAALLQSGTLTEAARLTHITPRALYDRMGYRDFQTIYTAAKSDIIRAAVNGLCADLATACQTIRDVMADPANKPETRLQAAKVFIDSAIRLSDHLQGIEKTAAQYTVSPLDMGFDKI